MSRVQSPGDSPGLQAASAQPPTLQFVAPDLHQLDGDGIDVPYLPSGPGGKAWFTYQGPHEMLVFTGDQIHSVEVPDLGTVVSLFLVSTIDAGRTTFSVLRIAAPTPRIACL